MFEEQHVPFDYCDTLKMRDVIVKILRDRVKALNIESTAVLERITGVSHQRLAGIIYDQKYYNKCYKEKMFPGRIYSSTLGTMLKILKPLGLTAVLRVDGLEYDLLDEYETLRTMAESSLNRTLAQMPRLRYVGQVPIATARNIRLERLKNEFLPIIGVIDELISDIQIIVKEVDEYSVHYIHPLVFKLMEAEKIRIKTIGEIKSDQNYNRLVVSHPFPLPRQKTITHLRVVKGPASRKDLAEYSVLTGTPLEEFCSKVPACAVLESPTVFRSSPGRETALIMFAEDMCIHGNLYPSTEKIREMLYAWLQLSTEEEQLIFAKFLQLSETEHMVLRDK